MNYKELQELLAQKANENPKTDSTNVISASNSIDTTSVAPIDTSINPIDTIPTYQSQDTSSQIDTTPIEDNNQQDDSNFYYENDLRKAVEAALSRDYEISQTHDKILNDIKTNFSYNVDGVDKWMLDEQTVNGIKDISREVSPYMKKFEGTDYITLTDEDWMGVAAEFQALKDSKGIEAATEHINKVLQDNVSENQGVLEKCWYGFAGMGATCAGALITTAGLFKGMYDYASGNSVDNYGLSGVGNFLNALIDNEWTRYGYDVTMYGAFGDNLEKAKELGLSDLEVVQTYDQAHNNVSSWESIFNVNTIPLALQQQGFTVASTIASFGTSGLFNTVTKGTKAGAVYLATKNLTDTAEKIARSKQIISAVNTADRFLNVTVTPAIVGSVEGIQEGLGVKLDIQDKGYARADAILQQRIQADIMNELQARGIEVSMEGGSLHTSPALSEKEFNQLYEAAYQKNELSYLQDLAQVNYIASNEGNNDFLINSFINGALGVTLKAGFMAPRVQKAMHDSKIYKKVSGAFESSPFIQKGNVISAKAPNLFNYAWEFSKEGLGEFGEEFIQTTASNAFEAKGMDYLDTWLDMKYNSDTVVEIGSDMAYGWGAALDAATNSLTDAETWKSGIMGVIGYALGQPIHNSQNAAAAKRGANQEDWSKARQLWNKYGISWNFGPVNAVRKLNQEYEANKAMAETLTNWLQNPNNLEKFNGVTGTFSWAKAMEECAQRNDEFGVRNSVLGKTVNDIMFLNKLQGTEFYNSTMKQLSDIAYAEKGSQVETDILTAFKANINTKDENMSDEEIISKVKQNATEMLDMINQVTQETEDVERTFGSLDDDTKQSLIYKHLAIKDWQKRKEKLQRETSGVSVNDIKTTVASNKATEEYKNIRKKYGSYDEALAKKNEATAKVAELEKQIENLEERNKKAKLSEAEQNTLSQKRKELKKYKQAKTDLDVLENYNKSDDLLNEQDIMNLDPIERAKLLLKGRLKYAQKREVQYSVQLDENGNKQPLRDENGDIVVKTVRGKQLLSDEQQAVVENLINQLNLQDKNLVDKLIDLGKVENAMQNYQLEIDRAFVDGRFLANYAIKAKEEAANALLAQKAESIGKIQDFKSFSREMTRLMMSDERAYVRVANKLKRDKNSNYLKYEQLEDNADKLRDRILKNPKYKNLTDNQKNLIDVALEFLSENEVDVLNPDEVAVALSNPSKADEDITEFEAFLGDVNSDLEENEKIAPMPTEELIALFQNLIQEVENINEVKERTEVEPITEEQAQEKGAVASENPEPAPTPQEPSSEEEEEEKAWSNLWHTHTLEAYNEFLKKYPEGKHSEDARLELELLQKDKDDWEKATQANTMDSYLEYLENHPAGNYRNEARQRRKALEEGKTVIVNDANGKELNINDTVHVLTVNEDNGNTELTAAGTIETLNLSDNTVSIRTTKGDLETYPASSVLLGEYQAPTIQGTVEDISAGPASNLPELTEDKVIESFQSSEIKELLHYIFERLNTSLARGIDADTKRQLLNQCYNTVSLIDKDLMSMEDFCNQFSNILSSIQNGDITEVTSESFLNSLGNSEDRMALHALLSTAYNAGLTKRRNLIEKETKRQTTNIFGTKKNGSNLAEAWKHNRAIRQEANVNNVQYIDSIPLQISEEDEKEQSDTVAKYITQWKMVEYLTKNKATLGDKNKNIEIFYIRHPQFEKEMIEEIQKTGNYVEEFAMPIVAVVQDDNGPIEIDGKKYQPIAILPQTTNHHANGASATKRIREFAKNVRQKENAQLIYDDNNKLLVSHGIYGQVVGVAPANIPENQPNRALLDICTQDATAEQKEEFNRKRANGELSKDPLWKKVVEKIAHSISTKKATANDGREYSAFFYEADNLKGGTTPLQLFITPVHNTIATNSNNTILDLLRTPEASDQLISANYFMHQFSSNLKKFFVENFENDKEGSVSPTFTSDGDNTEEFNSALEAKSKELSSRLTRYLDIPTEYQFKVVYVNGAYRLIAFNEIDTSKSFLLGDFKDVKNISNTELAIVFRNLMLDEDNTNPRLRTPDNPKSNNFAVWNVQYDEVKAKDDGTPTQKEIGMSRTKNYIESNVFEISKNSVEYTTLGVSVNMPTAIADEFRAVRERDERSNPDNASTNPNPEEVTNPEEIPATNTSNQAEVPSRLDQAHKVLDKLKKETARLNEERKGKEVDATSSEYIWVTQMTHADEDYINPYENVSQEENIWQLPSTKIGNTVDKWAKTILRNQPIKCKINEQFVTLNLTLGNNGKYYLEDENDKKYTLTGSELPEEARVTNCSEDEAQFLVQRLIQAKQLIEERGETIVQDNLAILGTMTVADDQGITWTANMVAGPDILTIDRNGVYHIYDVKSANSKDKFDEGGDKKKDWQMQMSIYKLFLEQQGATVANDLRIIQVQVNYARPDSTVYIEPTSQWSNQLRVKKTVGGRARVASYTGLTFPRYTNESTNMEEQAVPVLSERISFRSPKIKFNKIPEDVRQKLVQQSPAPAAVEPSVVIPPITVPEEIDEITGLPMHKIQDPNLQTSEIQYSSKIPSVTDEQLEWGQWEGITNSDDSSKTIDVEATKKALEDEAFIDKAGWADMSSEEKKQKLSCHAVWK